MNRRQRLLEALRYHGFLTPKWWKFWSPGESGGAGGVIFILVLYSLILLTFRVAS